MEIWKEVDENKDYEVSTLGNVRSKRQNGKWGKNLKPALTKRGRLRVALSRKTEKHLFRSIHRLVGIAFIPNPMNLPEINHLDGNPLNNNVTNLEWSTRIDNNKHAVLNNLNAKGEKISSKLTNKQVEIIKECLEAGIKTEFLATKFKVCNATIRSIKKEEYWKHIKGKVNRTFCVKISIDKLLEIEKLLLTDVSIREICRRTNTFLQTVNKIKHGKYKDFKDCFIKYFPDSCR